MLNGRSATALPVQRSSVEARVALRVLPQVGFEAELELAILDPCQGRIGEEETTAAVFTVVDVIFWAAIRTNSPCESRCGGDEDANVLCRRPNLKCKRRPWPVCSAWSMSMPCLVSYVTVLTDPFPILTRRDAYRRWDRCGILARPFDNAPLS